MKEEKISDRSIYQRDYYKRKKDELSEKRKARYRSDPDVRKRAKESSKRYRELKKVERRRMIDEGLIDVSKKRRHRRQEKVYVNGSLRSAYTITTMAERLGRSHNTLNNWICNGIIPKTPFRSKRGDRLYTDAMILIIKMAIQPIKRMGKDFNVRARIEEGWERYGVISDDS